MKSGFYDSRGQLQRLSFTQAFLGPYLTQRTLRQQKNGVKIIEVQKPADTATAPPSNPPAPTPPGGTPQPEATPAATEEAKPEETPLTWTALEDATLIGLKALDRTWKEIGAIMKDKPTEDLRERYDELNIKTVKAKVAKTKEDETKSSDEGDTDSDHEGKKKSKGKKGKEKKGNEMSDEAKEKKAKAMAAKAEKAKEKSAEAETADSTKGKPLKGILKKGKGSQKKDPVDRDPTYYPFRQIFYVDSGEALNAGELMKLHGLHEALDRKKWVELSSKFFDKTGRRASPEILQEGLKNF